MVLYRNFAYNANIKKDSQNFFVISTGDVYVSIFFERFPVF